MAQLTRSSWCPAIPSWNFPPPKANTPTRSPTPGSSPANSTPPQTGRSFAFLTIFNKNRPGGTVVADFYTLALFDLDTGDYGTYTDYDMPPANMKPGAQRKLTMATGIPRHHVTKAAPAPRRGSPAATPTGNCCPTPTAVSLVGEDHSGRPMRLDLAVTPTRAPTPVGASTYNGKIVCFGQTDTYSYFQTGMAMTGTLRWGESVEEVCGSGGHVDRQWFPKYAGGGGSRGRPAGQVARMAHH